MGIPRLFANIIKRYRDTHFWKNNFPIDCLFLDFNNLIHTSKNNTLKNFNGSSNKIEELIIQNIINDTSHIINDIVKPKKLVYISIDGPAPVAKMVQQRSRRYKKIKEEEYLKNLQEKYQISDNSNLFNSNEITPGTKFMNNLNKSLDKAIKSGKFGNTKIILNDQYVPGEGEHKIIFYIKNMKNDNKIAIYGLDADLIVLSLSTGKEGIYLLREPQKSPIEEELYQGIEYIYFSIDKFKEYFINEVRNGINNDNIITDQQIVYDYIFLTFLSGNDFIKPIPYLSIKDGGLDITINCYKTVLNKLEEPLINFTGSRVTINTKFFRNLVNELNNLESELLKKKQHKMNNYNNYDTELTGYELEKSYYMHTPYHSELNPFYDVYKPILDKINYLEPSYKLKIDYYTHFGIDYCNKMVFKKFCMHYLQSLSWTLKYYLLGVPSWTWHYRPRVAPFLSDINYTLNNVSKHDNNSEILNQFKFEIEKPLTPYQQLLSVLPLQNNDLLPEKYRKLTENELMKYYPIDFQLDAANGLKHIYSEPILPGIEIETIINSTKEIELTTEEEERNKIKRNYKVYNS